MSSDWPALGRALGVVVAGSLIAAATPAFAERPVVLSFQETPSYARIIAKWGDGDENAPRLGVSVASQVLIVRFEEKVTINLKALKDGLPGWAAVARLDPDGKTLRIGLKQTPRLKTSTSADLTAIDLATPTATADPPPLVSPLIARRAAEQQAKRVAAAPPPPIAALEVRGSHSGESSRIAFYWEKPTPYTVVSEKPGELQLLFKRRAKADIAYLRVEPPPNLGDFTGENTDKGYLATITSKDGLPITHVTDGNIPIVDISRPAKEKSGDIGAPVVSRKPAPKAAARSSGADLAEAEPASAAAASALPISLLPDAGAKLESPAAGTAAASSVVAGAQRISTMSPGWKDGAPPSGVVDVIVLPTADGLEMRVPFASATPAAVFQRAGVTWAVFAASADLKLDPVALPTGYRARAMRAESATILRIEAPKGVALSASSKDAVWTIRLSATGAKPERFLKATRVRAPDGAVRIETVLPGAAGVVWFEDSVIGDEIAAVVAYGAGASFSTPRDFIEALMPATAHGLAVSPRSDNVYVTLEGETAVVTMPSVASSSESVAVGESRLGGFSANPAYIDFETWGGAQGDAWFKKRKELERASLRDDPQTPDGAAALLDLARFYLGSDLAHEAAGVLRMAVEQRPALEQDAQFLGLSGAASFLAHRFDAAEVYLSQGNLRGDPSAALWRGAAASEKGDWSRASDFFRAADNQGDAYPKVWAARFAAYQSEAAFHTNDFDTARRMANRAIAEGGKEYAERGKLVLARLLAAIEGPEKAYDEFARLAKSPVEPVAVQAELKRLEIGVAAKRISAEDSASQLESLRFRWRGDNVEMATVGILADQYMNVGRFREALQLAQSAALRDPDAPGARELRIRVTDYFRRLFLDGDADRLDPIQALALFYEFATLTPIGVDGDQMIRKLAQRLVAFDLLEPAAQLLHHQVDNRLRGVSKSALAVDLATIYLLDKRPDQALIAINTTRQPGLPRELAMQRRLLEAAAYRDLGRFDHVVELTEPLESPEARALLADAYMRDRKFAQAARTYLAMLPPPKDATPTDAGPALKAAIAARLAKNPGMVAEVKAYGALFEGDGNKASFDLITSQTDVSGAAISEAARRLADAPSVDAFSQALKSRLAKPPERPAERPPEPPPAQTVADASGATPAE